MWAFNDFLLLRLLASIIPASSRTKVRGAAPGFLSTYTPFDYGKKTYFLLKPSPAGHFRQFV
jgi:hypothetical protein